MLLIINALKEELQMLIDQGYEFHRLYPLAIDNYLDNAGFVNLALACELYLKAIYIISYENVIEGHSLYDLFTALPDEAKISIKEIMLDLPYKHFTKESIEDCIKRVANTFINGDIFMKLD